MPIRRRQTLLLDLDGTLVDPARGIVGCCRHALERVGAPVAEDVDLSWIIGPPLRSAFARLLGAGGDVETAMKLYRQAYSDWGLYQAEPYPGLADVLRRRREDGARLLLCTSKPAVFARRVVDHFGFAELLAGVYGPDLDGTLDDKGELIAHLLGAEGLDPHAVCMVGDREHDVRAASRNGVPTVGVLWGYGSRAELEGAGAEVIVATPAELLA